MQIMEGDICRTIRDNFPWIAHFHTGGVPGRHDHRRAGVQTLNEALAIMDVGRGASTLACRAHNRANAIYK
jgi:hydroxypyruvate isomerase